MGLLLQRALLGALGAVAPRTAARRAATLFSTPRRRVATRTPRPEPAWIDAAGFRLAVYGRGPGAPVFLAHGWEGSAHDLAPIGDALDAALLAPPRHPEAHLRAFTRALGMNAVRHAGVRRELERRVGPVERFDSGLAARALAVPGLVIHDLGDRQVPFEDGVAIAEAWAGSELRAVEGLGHRRILRTSASRRTSCASCWPTAWGPYPHRGGRTLRIGPILRIRSSPTTTLLAAGHEEGCSFAEGIRRIPELRRMRPPDGSRPPTPR